MGWHAKGPFSCPQSNVSKGIKSAGSPGDFLWPLGAAIYYPSLKYQCCGLVKGTLCAYGADPQSLLAYAVDEEGNFLTRKLGSERYSFYRHLGVNPTVTRVYGAAVSMIAVAGLAVLFTLVLLSCLPYTGPSPLLLRISRLCV